MSDFTDADIVEMYRAFLCREGRHPSDRRSPEERYLVRRMRSISQASAETLAPSDRRQMVGARYADLARKVRAFIDEHEREPSARTGSTDEQELGNWLVYTARPAARHGKLAQSIIDELGEHAHVLDGRPFPDQNAKLEELRSFLASHDYLPSMNVPEEVSLALWVANNRKPRPGARPNVAARFTEVARMLDEHRAHREHLRQERRDAAIAAAREAGHLPLDCPVWLREAAPDLPTFRDFRVERRIRQLEFYIDEHGHLPRANASDPMWMTIRRAREGVFIERYRPRVLALVHNVPTYTEAQSPTRTGPR